MTEPDLHHLLARAADDTGRPPVTDGRSLLDRARRTHRRRRRLQVAGALGGVAALTAGAALVVPALAGGEGPPVTPTVTPAVTPTPPPTSEPTTLTPAEVARRCEPQLAKYRELPMYSQLPHEVVHPRDYAPGDVVALMAPNGGNPVLCLVPATGAEDEPVPFERFLPDADDEQSVAEVCAEVNQATPPWWHYFPPGPGQPRRTAEPRWVDLRTATVTQVGQEGVVTTALLERGGKAWQCTISPASWDVGLTDVQPTTRGPVYLNASATGAAGKSIVQEEASWYTGAGLTDPRAATLVLRFADGTTAERPVEQGRYAVVVRVPGAGGVQDVDVDVLDAGGRTLASYPAP